MAKKLRPPPRLRIRTDSLIAVLELGRFLLRHHERRHGEQTLQKLAKKWRTSVIHLRRARLFATRCSRGEVRQRCDQKLRWTHVRHLIGIPSRDLRDKIAERASGMDDLTVEKFAALVAPHIGRRRGGRPAVELKRLRRRCEQLTSAIHRCNFREKLPQRLYPLGRSARAAVRKVRLRLQAADDSLSRMLGN